MSTRLATVNREVATLGRMLSLAVGAGKLSRKPRFSMLEENNVRQGFLEHAAFLALKGKLPEHLQPLVEFLYLSGWRKSEGLKLEWRDVDLTGKVVRLRSENSKNKEARVLPITGRLLEMIQERAKARRLDCPYVFHVKGKKIGEFRKSWQTACVAGGLGRLEKYRQQKQKVLRHDRPRSKKMCGAKSFAGRHTGSGSDGSPATRRGACIDVTGLWTKRTLERRRHGYRRT
jgi:integrase